MATDNSDMQTIGKSAENIYHHNQKSEEIQDIIGRMPTKFGYRISALVFIIFCLLFLFGYIIRYPDVVKGNITINASLAPIKLVASSSGKMHLNIKSQSPVESADVVGYIESATSYDTVETVKNVLQSYNPRDFVDTSILLRLPSGFALGELTSKYYNFLSCLRQMANFNINKLYDKQIASLESLYKYQINEVTNSSGRISVNTNALKYSHKFFVRDSILFSQKVASEAEFDKTQMDYLNTEADFLNARTLEIDAQKQAQQTLAQISEVNIQKNEKGKELEIALLAAFNDLEDNITSWEQKYVFKSPFKGKLQFLQFWTNQQFVQAGEPVFSIIPEANEPSGQVILPAIGAGKVKIGQEVIVKLDDFPYNEYGSITGTVSSISLSTNTEKTSNGDIETYLLTVQFLKGLNTNYGRRLAFKHASKGTAEIITKDRRLIERLFDNLKYVVSK